MRRGPLKPGTSFRRRARARVPSWLLLVLGALLMSLPSMAESQRSPSEVAADVQARGGYSDEVQHIDPSGGEPIAFPSGGGGGGDDARRDGRRGGSDIERYQRGQDFENIDAPEDSDGLDLALPSIFGQGLGYLLMVIAGLGLVALIVVLVMTFWPKGPLLDPAPPPPVVPPHSALIEALPWNPGDPAELARAGRYAEAIVALLVQALKASGWREVERARTAREVLRALVANDPRRAPLGQVVGRAEHVRFAGVEATLERYEEVRALVDLVLRAPAMSSQLPPTTSPAPPADTDAP